MLNGSKTLVEAGVGSAHFITHRADLIVASFELAEHFEHAVELIARDVPAG